MNDSREREGRALAGPPAALLKDEENLSQYPLLSCFQAVNNPEISIIPFVNSNINCVELVPS